MPFPYKFSCISQKIKSAIHGYTEWEEKADIASNAESWGPSTAQLSELASGTFHPIIRDEILRILLKKLRFRPTHWKQCHKALVCLEYIIKNGDVGAIPVIKRCVQIIRYIAEHFTFTEGHEDRGKIVRAQAHLVMNILESSDSIMKERAAAKSMRGKIMGVGSEPDIPSARSVGPETQDIHDYSSPQDIQERQDYILALKLQKEEERRSGVRLNNTEFAQPPRPYVPRAHAAKYPSDYRHGSSIDSRQHGNVYDDIFDVQQPSTRANQYSADHAIERAPREVDKLDVHFDAADSSLAQTSNSEVEKAPSRRNPPGTNSEGRAPKEFDFSELFSDMEIVASRTEEVSNQKSQKKPTEASKNVEDLF